MEDLTNSNPENGSSATMTTSPEATTGTVQANGDAGQSQGAPIEETFTKVDVNTLPPQLRESYNNMLRDYKQKTTQIAETVKSEVARATEALKTKSE